MKYENLINSMQEPITSLAEILNEEKGLNLNKAKFDLKDIKEIIIKILEFVQEPKRKIGRNKQDLSMLKVENETVDDRNNLLRKISELKIELDKSIKDRYILETRLDSKLNECEAMYEKGKKDGAEATRFESSGILSAKTKCSGQNEDMSGLINIYKGEIERYKETTDELFGQNNELKLHNEKANEEILALVGRLKIEQEKQRQLSYDLETLRTEMKARRLSEYSY